VTALPTRLSTDRLVLRWPSRGDAAAVVAYAGDPDSTRFMSWPYHRSAATACDFVDTTLRDHVEGRGGAYLIELDGRVIGSTGLHLDPAWSASTGYILARAHWGRGFATEACRAMIALGRERGLVRVWANCHVDNRASARVLDKVGMQLEGLLRRHTVFPQIGPHPEDVWTYAWVARVEPDGFPDSLPPVD